MIKYSYLRTSMGTLKNSDLDVRNVQHKLEFQEALTETAF